MTAGHSRSRLILCRIMYLLPMASLALGKCGALYSEHFTGNKAEEPEVPQVGCRAQSWGNPPLAERTRCWRLLSTAKDEASDLLRTLM